VTARDFIAKWRASTLKERSAALADDEVLVRLLALNREGSKKGPA